MEFNLFKTAVGNIQNTIETAAITSVRAIKAHTFAVTIKNFKKVQDIKGTVTVANQKRVESELKKSNKLQTKLLDWLQNFKPPTSINVDNFPDYPEFPEFPKEIRVTNMVDMPEYPKKIRISNQPTKEIKAVADRISSLEKTVKALKLNPKINVEAPKPERVVVPPANVSVTQQEIDYDRLAALIPVPDKIDYEKLGDILATKIAEMAVTVGGGGGSRKEGLDDLTRNYNISDKDIENDIKYYGFVGKSGDWYILREDTTDNTYRYVKGSSGYLTNWNNRESLTYDYYHEVF